MSAKCQKQTFCVAVKPMLFDLLLAVAERAKCGATEQVPKTGLLLIRITKYPPP
jgi:hypothetical protein